MKRYLVFGLMACMVLSLSSCVGDDFVAKTPVPAGAEESPPAAANPEVPQEAEAEESAPAQFFAVKGIVVAPVSGEAIAVSFVYQDGKLMSVSRISPETTTEPIPTKEEFQYDTGGRIAEIKRYYGDSISNPVLSEKEMFEYNSNGFLKKYTRFGGKELIQTNIDEYACKDDGSCEIKSKIYDSKNKKWVDASGAATINFDGNLLPVSFLRISAGAIEMERMCTNSYDESGKVLSLKDEKVFPKFPFKDSSWTWTVNRNSENKLTRVTVDLEAKKPNCFIVQADGIAADGRVEKETLLKFEGKTCEGSAGGGVAAETHTIEYEGLASKPVMPPMHMLKLVPKETLIFMDDAAAVFGRGINAFMND